MSFLLKGLVLGFSIAAPVGPIGLLCIKRTLSQGRLSGFVSGLGAATADGLYGFVAAFGLTAVSGFLLEYELPIRIVGTVFLLYLAFRIFFSRPAHNVSREEGGFSLFTSYASTFFLTLTNPATILSFVALFAGLGVGGHALSYSHAVLIVVGVFLGSAIWWLLLSYMVGLFSHHISDRSMIWINRTAGVLMMLLGVISFSAILNI